MEIMSFVRLVCYIACFYAVVLFELPWGVAHVDPMSVHSTFAWVATHVTSFALRSGLTVARFAGKWKNLQLWNVHVLPSYALRQHNTVKLFGFIGCGNIGPG